MNEPQDARLEASPDESATAMIHRILRTLDTAIDNRDWSHVAVARDSLRFVGKRLAKSANAMHRSGQFQ
jgi:hypothetical protein